MYKSAEKVWSVFNSSLSLGIKKRLLFCVAEQIIFEPAPGRNSFNINPLKFKCFSEFLGEMMYLFLQLTWVALVCPIWVLNTFSWFRAPRLMHIYICLRATLYCTFKKGFSKVCDRPIAAGFSKNTYAHSAWLNIYAGKFSSNSANMLSHVYTASLKFYRFWN